ncbi:MAG: segregation/condensation protein A [Deltaproteobacteria bacterium]|nr:segregation/condensation protein A [Deltaproteobacteria bacterium]
MPEREALNVKLDIFEGPLDLLLHLIRKDKVDIYDIPIALITEKYIEYLDVMKKMNLDIAVEFIVMAATLIHIKSKMLLPIPEEGEEAEEGTDPREELMRKLLEYKRFRSAAEELEGRLVLGRDVFTRGMPFPFPDGLYEEEAPVFGEVSLFDLIGAFKDIMKRMPHPYTIDLTVDRFRVADKINHLLEVLSRERSIAFLDLFPPGAERGEIIVTFLAVLELARLLMIKVNQSGDGAIRVRRNEAENFREEVH